MWRGVVWCGVVWCVAWYDVMWYGQCSEICGVNHGFMPIVVEAVSLEDYVSWISSKIELVEESV